MNLDRALARADFIGDLLVQQTTGDEIAHLTFARRQLREQQPGNIALPAAAAANRVQLDGM